MGLGVEPGAYDDIEWFSVDDVVDEPTNRHYADAALQLLREQPVWSSGSATRVLLVDLDNLRVEPRRLHGRVTMAVTLARDADYAVFAGQQGSVRRARESLAEFASKAIVVGNGADAADHALLDAAAAIDADEVEFAVLSNDGIFARLAMRGSLTVLSPGAAAMSGRLLEAATRVADLASAEDRAIAR